jgi:hypothetical protein
MQTHPAEIASTQEPEQLAARSLEGTEFLRRGRSHCHAAGSRCRQAEGDAGRWSSFSCDGSEEVVVLEKAENFYLFRVPPAAQFGLRRRAQQTKVFCFFFSKKKTFLPSAALAGYAGERGRDGRQGRVFFFEKRTKKLLLVSGPK